MARALRLDEVERSYLFQIARAEPRRARRRTPARVQRVRPGIRRILETLDDVMPAFVFGRRMDILAANRLARALITDFEALPPRDRNMLRYMFLDESARELYLDWEEVALGQRRGPVPGRRPSPGRPAADRTRRRTRGQEPGIPALVGRPQCPRTQSRQQALPPSSRRRSHRRLRKCFATRRSRSDAVHLHRRGGLAVGDRAAAARRVDRAADHARATGGRWFRCVTPRARHAERSQIEER